MKKLLLLIFVLCFSLSYAQTILVEEFNYTAGSLLTANGWTFSSGSSNALTITSPGLTVTNYASNAGNAVTLTNTGEDDYKTFTPVSSGSVYLSFLINVQTAGSGDYFIAMSPATQTNYTARVFIKSNGNGFDLGISKTNENSAGALYGNVVLELNTTYMVVVKYIFNTGSNLDDSISLFAFKFVTVGMQESAMLINNYTYSSDPTKTDALTIESVTLRQGSSSAGVSPTLKVDGIRIATTWNMAVFATDVEENGSILPTKFELSQNYPNPFNPSTTIKYQVPQNSFVSVNVYDILGNQVGTLVREEKAAGSYELRFDASNMPSGVYFYKIQAGNFTQTKKMILMK